MKINQKMHKIRPKIYEKKSEIGRFRNCRRSGVSGEKLVYVVIIINFKFRCCLHEKQAYLRLR